MLMPITTFNALKEQGKLDEAIEAYNKAIAFKPDYADCLLQLGLALKEQGNLEEAIKAYNKALSIKPDNADTLTTWAMLSKSKAS